MAIGGTCSGGFRVEKNEHGVTGLTLHETFYNPICSVPDAEPQRQHDSGSAKGSLFEFPNIETDCYNPKDYAYYFQEVGSNEVFVNKFNWAVIGPGEGSISLERQKVLSLQEDTGGGGNITLGYSTGYKDVVFY